MELGKQIRFYRQAYKLSQDELADRVYVTRQTISNWENDKSYPDVNSLILLSEVFHTSLDKLIKGDIEMMREEIRREQEDVKKLNRYGTISGWLMGGCIVLTAPMMILMGKWSVVPLGVFIAASVYFGQKIEKIKKKNDIQTYREVVAFTEGVRLDEIQRQREIGKRPYQKILMTAVAAVVAATVSFVIAYVMLAIINS